MIKCFFVDVKSISSDLPRSTFAESELDRLADLIIETDGLLRPLILKQVGIEQYTVIEGHREYYAALKAKDKDLKKAEMVNAFIIHQKTEQSAIDQLKLLVENIQPITNPSVPNESKDREVEQLLPALKSIISQQLQPIYQEISKVTSQIKGQGIEQLLPAVDSIISQQLQMIYQELGKVTSQLDEHKSILESLKPPSIIKPLPIPIDDILNLINTLSETDLSLRMQQVEMPKAAVKLVPTIIIARNNQPTKKFDRWETFISEVKGLGRKTAQIIAEKLR